MTREQKLTLMKERLNKLSNSEKNIKSPGCVRKLKRQIQNLNSLHQPLNI